MAEYKGLRADKKTCCGERAARNFDGLRANKKARIGKRTKRDFKGYRAYITRFA